jgi:hypothetical protein
MMSLDIRVLSGNTAPSIVYGSFNGRFMFTIQA